MNKTLAAFLGGAALLVAAAPSQATMKIQDVAWLKDFVEPKKN